MGNASGMDMEATPARLRAIADNCGLSPNALNRAIQIADNRPDSGEWGRFMSYAMLAIGSALALAGVICFFAYNWANMGKFIKFGLVEAAIVAMVVGAWKLLPRMSGKAALTAASVLVGPLLAVYGQTYQTGADPYQLFLSWALLIIPWVVLGMFDGLWLAFMAILNTALILYGQQIAGRGMFLEVFLLNGAGFVAWEAQSIMKKPWFSGRWLAGILSIGAFLPLVISGVSLIVGHEREMRDLVDLFFFLGATVLVWLHYRGGGTDEFVLSVSTAGVMVLVTALIGNAILKNGDHGALLFMALVIIAQVAAAVAWIRWNISRREGGV